MNWWFRSGLSMQETLNFDWFLATYTLTFAWFFFRICSFTIPIFIHNQMVASFNGSAQAEYRAQK